MGMSSADQEHGRRLWQIIDLACYNMKDDLELFRDNRTWTDFAIC